MTLGAVAVAMLVILMAAGAAFVMIRDKRLGRNGCGCSCKSCEECRSHVVDIEEGCEHCKDES